MPPTVDVELDENRDVPRDRHRTVPGAGVPVRGAVVLAAILATGIVVGIVVDRVQEARRAEVLMSLGFASGLTEPVTVAWQSDGATPLLDDGRTLVAGTDQGLVGLDLGTGTPRWSLAGTGTCTAVLDGEQVTALGPVIARGADALLWCQDRGAHDRVVDPADGTVVAERTVDGAALLAVVLDGDLIRLQIADGLVDASRWSLDGTLRWAVSLDVLAQAVPTVSLESGGARARIIGSRVALLDLATGLEVDAAAAAAAPPADRRTVTRTSWSAGGERVEQRDGPGLLPMVAAVGPDEVEWWQASGELARPERDDGSEPDVTVVRSGGVLAGTEVRTGERRWSFLEPAEPAILVDGVLVAHGPDVVVALRVADGAVLWRHDATPLVGRALTGDGQVVVTTDAGDLVARAMSDGSELWRVEMPGAMWAGVLSDGSVLVLGETEVTVLR